MHNDEQQIHQLINDWMAATKARDSEKVLSLVADDAVFLTAGQSPMYKEDFAKISKQQAKPDAPGIDGKSEIQEIKISGDWAFAWTKLSITITSGSTVNARAGYTLTIFKKENGKWLLARDANLLAPVPKSTP